MSEPQLVLNNESINDIFTRSFLNAKLAESEPFNPFQQCLGDPDTDKKFLIQMIGKEVDEKYVDAFFNAMYEESTAEIFTKENLGDDIFDFLIKANSSLPPCDSLLRTCIMCSDPEQNQLTESEIKDIIQHGELIEVQNDDYYCDKCRNFIKNGDKCLHYLKWDLCTPCLESLK